MTLRELIVRTTVGLIESHAEAIQHILKEPIPLSLQNQGRLTAEQAEHTRYMTFLRRFQEATPAQHETSPHTAYDIHTLQGIVGHLLAMDAQVDG